MRAIDLFCGTGGFSRGAHAAGFDVAAAFDIDPNLTFSFGKNFPNTKLALEDVGELTAEKIRKHAGDEPIDLMFGGPPCQGFSLIGKRDENDPRRSLLGHFFRLVGEIRPTVFIMENVEGLLAGNARRVLDDALDHLDGYTILEPKVFNAADFGAATNRRRAFVIGYDSELRTAINWSDVEAKKSPPATVEDAIGDLKTPSSVGEDDRGFDVWRIRKNARETEYSKSMLRPDRTFTGNRRTEHLQRVIDRFATIKPGGFDPIGKYPRLAWDAQCPTLRAGTGADHGSHQAVRPIHPTENRVITVREAARIQGFPDEHYFHPTIWHSFRQIGNSVSPIIARAILSVVHEKLIEESYAEAAE